MSAAVLGISQQYLQNPFFLHRSKRINDESTGHLFIQTFNLEIISVVQWIHNNNLFTFVYLKAHVLLIHSTIDNGNSFIKKVSSYER